MFRYIVARIVWTIPTVVLVVGASFGLLHLVPGDAARTVAGIDADGATVERVRAELGLDRPLPAQFLDYAVGVARLDFGNSLHTRRPVRSDIGEAVIPTMELAFTSIAIAVVVGLPLGVAAAYHRGRIGDLVTSGIAAMGVSAPAFWVGLMLIAFFSVTLGWLPTGGRGTWRHLVLPSLTLSLLPLAMIARLTRSAVLEVLQDDYVQTARAKGASEWGVMFIHVLRNASLPVLTITGLQFGAALSGAVVVETVFSWPGLGRLLVTAIFRRDFPVLQGSILVIALFFILINLLVDLAYAVLDPRIRLGQK